MTFSQLPLADPLLRAVEEAGYTCLLYTSDAADEL